LRDVFPQTRVQRDWVHKTMNILDAMPKSVHSRAKPAIREIICAEDNKHAEDAIKAFANEFSAKWPKAVSKIEDDKETLAHLL
jgi:putative transposase